MAKSLIVECKCHIEIIQLHRPIAGDNLAMAQNTNLPLSLLCVLAEDGPQQFPAPRYTFIAIIIAVFLLKYLPYRPRY